MVARIGAKDVPAFTFVFPNVLNGRLFAGCDYHLGTAYIRAFLAKHGVASNQYVDDGRYSLIETARRIIADGAELIGFSCYDANYHMVRVLAWEVRRQAPDIPIILGGPSSTFSDMVIMNDCAAVDVCCRSYAEETALDLVRWRRGQTPIEEIEGVSYRSADGIVRNADRKQVTRVKALAASAKSDQLGFHDTGGTLDAYPDPYLTGFLPPTRVSDIGLVTSRGCTYSCTFCNFSAMSGWSVATHSIEYQLSVFRHLDAVLAGTPTLVTINDDNFSLQGKRFHELLRRMGREDYRSLSFWAEMRTETLADETFDLLKAAPFDEINFGLESAVPRVLAAMKKVRASGWDRDDYAKERRFLERVRWAVAKARQAGIRTTLSIILGAPTETFEDGLETLNFVRDVEADGYSHNFMVVGDGTELAENYESFGIKSEYPRDRVLPTKTTVAYDIYQLPILANDRSWLPMSSFEMRQISHIHSGAGNLQKREILPMGNGRGGGGRALQRSQSDDECVSQPVVMLAEEAVDQDLCDWITREFPLNMSLWLDHRSPHSLELAQQLVNTARVPVPELNAFRITAEHQGTSLFRINEFSADAPEFNTRSLRRQRVSETAIQMLTDRRNHRQREANVLRLERSEDLDAFRSWARPNGSWSVPNTIAAARVDLEDACKWCSGGCPASSLSRILVAPDRSIKTCHSGDPIGQVGDTLFELKARLTTTKQDIERQRGCSSCVVRDSCAKCLFVAPLTVEEYCARKRARPDETTLMDGLVAMRALHDSDALSGSSTATEIRPMHQLDGSVIEQDGISFPAADFIFVDQGSDENAILYSHRANMTLSIRGDGGGALRALI